MNITHIHPMLVHFPIVLFLVAVAAQFYIVGVEKGDLAGPDCVAKVALTALLIGTIAAAAAAIFGDIALEHAEKLGFPEAELDEHEELGFATLWFFMALTAVHIGARWRNISLSGGRGWALALIGLGGIGLMVAAASHGGELVYELGVNVDAVTP